MTLHHPHGQIYAYPDVPPRPAREIAAARAHHERTGRCVFCDVVAAEAGGVRVVVAGEHFVAGVPPWARFPYEIDIWSRAHVPSLPERRRRPVTTWPASWPACSRGTTGLRLQHLVPPRHPRRAHRRRRPRRQPPPPRDLPAAPGRRQAQVPRRVGDVRRRVPHRRRARGGRGAVAGGVRGRDGAVVSADVADRDVGQTFRDALGRDPDGVFSAPGRVNLIGEHTDHNERRVCPSPSTGAAVSPPGARRRHRHGALPQAPDDVVTTTLDALPRARGWSAYALGTVWALRRRAFRAPGGTSWCTARSRSGRACRRPRPWRARSRWRSGR